MYPKNHIGTIIPILFFPIKVGWLIQNLYSVLTQHRRKYIHTHVWTKTGVWKYRTPDSHASMDKDKWQQKGTTVTKLRNVWTVYWQNASTQRFFHRRKLYYIFINAALWQHSLACITSPPNGRALLCLTSGKYASNSGKVELMLTHVLSSLTKVS